MIGQTLMDGRYEISSRIGQGRFSTVYRARDLKSGQDVAVRVLDGIETRPGFIRETREQAALDHESIIKTLEIIEKEGRIYLVMEYVNGPPLIDLVSRNAFPARDACTVVLGIARVMALAQDRASVHGNLTLNDILSHFDEAGRPIPKIRNFQLVEKRAAEPLNPGSHAMGNSYYIAPEVIEGQAQDHRSDIFAFGVCLFRLLGEDFPFEAQHPTATLYLICHEDPAELSDDVPDALRELVRKCLARNPEDRPASFSLIARELKKILDESHFSEPSPSSLSLTAKHPGSGTPMDNPFLNRSMIQNPDEFFGREREVRKIFSRLDASHPQSISIVGEQRIGKSSLLNHIYNLANRKQFMGNHDDSIFAFLDFQGPTEFDIPGFISFLFSNLRLENRSIPEPKAGGNGLSLLQETVRSLNEQGKRILILMDAFERITNNPAFDEDFFSFLRSLANSYRVAYVTTSCDGLQNLCHNQDISDSPFFNIFSNLPLRPFPPEEAHQLIHGFPSDSGISLQGMEERILELAGYFPLFLQIACSCVFESLQKQPNEEPDWPSVTRGFLAEAQPQFEFIWQQMEEPEKENLFRVAAGEDISLKFEFVNTNLVRRGYLIERDGGVVIFAKTFQEFISQKRKSPQPKKTIWGFWKKMG